MGEHIKYYEIKCEKAINELKRKIPYGWDLNIYRGCGHGCRYCYAVYSHKYMEGENFFSDIYVKTNSIEQLEKQLSAPGWRREVVNIGGVTDSYQMAEARYKLMPEILKLLIKYKTPAIISTKSDLILRDFDLISELARITYVNVAATITAADEKVRTQIEPYAASSKARFDMLKQFRKHTNTSVGLHFMPIIPYLTDSYENMNTLFAMAHESNVHYVLPGVLYLKGETRKLFFDFISYEFPGLWDKLARLYKTEGADKAYKNDLYAILNPLREKWKLSKSYMKPMREKLEQTGAKQMTLFDTQVE